MDTTMDDGFQPDKKRSEAGRGDTGRNRNSIITIALAGIIVAAVGFAGGVSYQKTRNTTAAAGNSGGFGRFANGQDGGSANGMRRMGAFGTVSAVSSDSITIKDQRSGGSNTYTITSDTTITDNGNTATISDIQTGDTVMIRTASTDDPTSSSASSKTASSIILNPQMGNPGGRQSSDSQQGTGQDNMVDSSSSI